MTFAAMGNNSVELSNVSVQAPKNEMVFPKIDFDSVAAAIENKEISAPTIINNVSTPPANIRAGDSKTTIYPAYIVNQVDLWPIFWSSISISVAAIAIAVLVVLT